MSRQTLETIRRVLKEASEQEHFFDLSDAERLNWMIQRAYELGCAAEHRDVRQTQDQERPAWSPKRQPYQ